MDGVLGQGDAVGIKTVLCGGLAVFACLPVAVVPRLAVARASLRIGFAFLRFVQHRLHGVVDVGSRHACVVFAVAFAFGGVGGKEFELRLYFAFVVAPGLYKQADEVFAQ